MHSFKFIYNGYQASPSVWKNNARVKKFKVYDKVLCFLVLKDEMGVQYFELPDYSDEQKSMFRFEIIEVCEGAKYNDVAISEIEWSGCCFAENTLINNGLSMFPANELTTGQSISTLDLETGRTKEVKILKTAHQKHLALLVVSTPKRSIKITPENPLYAKGYGFISLSRLKKIVKAENYSDLVGAVELLVWSGESGKQTYESLSAIDIEKTITTTYTIRKLTEGTVFIANGFVTRTY